MPTLRDAYGNGLPEGDATALVEEVTKSVSKSGNPMLVYTLVLIDGPASGRRVSDFRSLQGQALWRLGRDLVALNVSNVELPDDVQARAESMVDLARKLVGAKVRIRLKAEGDWTRVRFLSLLEPPR